MENATLKQAAKIISLFNETPNEKVQALLASGLLADIRDGNVAQVNRDEFRGLLGLDPLIQNPKVKKKSKGRSSKLIIDRTKPFDPGAFIGEGWSIEEQDDRSLAFTEIDLTKVRLEHMLQPIDQGRVKGEEKLKRLKAASHVRLDAAVLKAFLINPHLIPDRWKGKRVYFDGTILRSPSVSRYVLCLYWDGSQWDWFYDGLDYYWNDSDPSAVLASV